MRARIRCQSPLPAECERGVFVPPTLIEIDSIARAVRRGVRPGAARAALRPRQRLAELIDAINATGYGLTLGIASRIDGTTDEIIERARVGNVYVNRNIIGAVVGVQPFGGQRLCRAPDPKPAARCICTACCSSSPGPQLAGHASAAARRRARRSPAALQVQIDWLGARSAPESTRELLQLRAERYAQRTLLGARLPLRGYVGESNELRLRPRGRLRATARSRRARCSSSWRRRWRPAIADGR